MMDEGPTIHFIIALQNFTPGIPREVRDVSGRYVLRVIFLGEQNVRAEIVGEFPRTKDGVPVPYVVHMNYQWDAERKDKTNE